MATGNGEPITVLYVDAEPESANTVSGFLEREADRFEVETARTAHEGLNRLATDEYQCVISAYDMPGSNGIEFLETVREERPDLPFILFPGEGSEAIASEAIGAGVTDYLPKGTGTEPSELLVDRVCNAVDQYLATAAADTTERRLQELTDSITDCLWMFDRDWEELLYISGYEAVWGRPTECITENPQDFINTVDPDDRPFVKRAMDRLSDGASIDIEYTIRCGDGEPGCLWTKGEPVFDDEGNVVRVGGFTRDITDRKRREQELERSRELFRGAERLGDLGAWEFDGTGGVVWTEGTRRIHEVSDDYEPALETATEFFHPEDRSDVEQAVEAALDRGEPYDLQARLITATDSKRWVRTRGEPTDDGETVRGYIQDITDQKRRERALQRERDRLEEFAGVVSHDLRNPLQVAEGQLELATDECDSPHLSNLSEALDRMDELIQDLLVLSRQGDPIGETEATGLNELAELCWRHIEASDATLEVRTEATISADRSRLQQLLENLLRNAVEHGGEDVTITIGALPDGFYLEDDGPGVPEHNRDRIFDPGYSRTDDGTGFGLAIVSEIIDAHGWEIDLTTSHSGGARFEISGVETVE